MALAQPIQSLAVTTLAAAAPVIPTAAPVTPVASAQEDAIASQDKVREMAQKLGIPFTQDLISLGSNAAISDALIEKAVALGKTEAQINSAMASL